MEELNQQNFNEENDQTQTPGGGMNAPFYGTSAKFCTSCGNQLYPTAAVCPKCGCPVNQIHKETMDPATAALCIFSFSQPIIGFILYFYYKISKPEVSASCIKWAVIGLGFVFFCMIIGAIVGAITGASILSSL